MLDGLLIRTPWIDKILDGTKTWETRGSHTYKEGRIALSESGTGTVVGVAELAGVVGPLSLKAISDPDLAKLPLQNGRFYASPEFL